MNLLKCNKGHYYDGDKFAGCPYCSGASVSSASDSVTIAMPSGSPEDVTVALSPSSSNDPVTIADSAESSRPEPSHLDTDSVSSYAGQSLPDDDAVTISYYHQAMEEPAAIEPVVGWLVCISGRYLGQSFPLKTGRNFIGRGSSMDICLEGESSVSRSRHAIIIYEPRGRIFFAQPGDSRELFYLNNNVVLNNEKLKPYDMLSIGTINMMLIPFCTERFAWEDLNEKEKDKKKKLGLTKKSE